MEIGVAAFQPGVVDTPQAHPVVTVLEAGDPRRGPREAALGKGLEKTAIACDLQPVGPGRGQLRKLETQHRPFKAARQRGQVGRRQELHRRSRSPTLGRHHAEAAWHSYLASTGTHADEAAGDLGAVDRFDRIGRHPEVGAAHADDRRRGVDTIARSRAALGYDRSFDAAPFEFEARVLAFEPAVAAKAQNPERALGLQGDARPVRERHGDETAGAGLESPPRSHPATRRCRPAIERHRPLHGLQAGLRGKRPEHRDGNPQHAADRHVDGIGDAIEALQLAPVQRRLEQPVTEFAEGIAGLYLVEDIVAGRQGCRRHGKQGRSEANCAEQFSRFDVHSIKSLMSSSTVTTFWPGVLKNLVKFPEFCGRKR